MKITEALIQSLAPNPGAVTNGKKLSGGGSFSAHGRNSDSTLFWADCAGSGKNPYHTSLDLSDPEGKVVSRCSCPSRQFPCKHAVGLMFEVAAAVDFPVSDVPDELSRKLEKQAQRRERSAAPSKPEQKPASNTWKKKIRKQLEGLDLARKMTEDLLRSGIASLSGSSAQTFEKAAKELANCYLTGPQLTFVRIAQLVLRMQEQPQNAQVHYAEAIRLLTSLHSTIKRAQVYLTQRLESGEPGPDDNVLFEALGGVWRLEDLKAVGAYRENIRLVQLSFDVTYDPGKKEYVDRGFWMDVDSGTISQTLNFRPAKALKYVKAEDSSFSLHRIPVLYEYPGERNRRIRWDTAEVEPITSSVFEKLLSFAERDLSQTVKLAKNYFKNTLNPKFMPVLLSVGSIGLSGEEPVLTDPAGNGILLRDRNEDGPDHITAGYLPALSEQIPGPAALFGLMYYDHSGRRICVHPYSILTPTQIIRLLY